MSVHVGYTVTDNTVPNSHSGAPPLRLAQSYTPRKSLQIIGSWMTAKRVIDQYGPEMVTLLFADVKGNEDNPYLGEDEDCYRFIRETAEKFGAELVWLNEGRNIWQVSGRHQARRRRHHAPRPLLLRRQPHRLHQIPATNTEVPRG